MPGILKINMAAVSEMQCDDFLEFKDALQKMRVLDDKIVYTLNNSIPTDSFKGQVDATKTCIQLYGSLSSNYARREAAIKECIVKSAEKVELLRAAKAKDYDNHQTSKDLRKAQSELRLMQSELNIEEIIKERTNKIYYERCRPFYKPDDLKL